MLAIAFDLGTTTIACSLVDRESGLRLAAAGALNPQMEFGADVVARLESARDNNKLVRMRELVKGEMLRLADGLLFQSGKGRGDVELIAVAGNPVMEQIFLGMPVESLARPPYKPLFRIGQELSASSLRWEFPASLYLFPLPGNFVGGDLVAFLYGYKDSNGPSLFVDLGTNGEIALVTRWKILATSVAAGPALEGGNLSCGMIAAPGAIAGVHISEDKLHISTIGAAAPRGICGSAVLELIALLRSYGVIDTTGRLLSPAEIPSNLANRVLQVENEPAFSLYRDAQSSVFLSQHDIRQVQLAKGAIAAGIEVLLEYAGMDRRELSEVVITGSFGAELNPDALKKVGIFKEKMVKKARFTREGALAGIEKMVRSEDGKDSVERLAAMIRVIPLSGTPAFEKHFLAQLNFPND